MEHTHTCQGLMVGCMDFRIQEALNRLNADLKLELGDFDRVSVAGGAGNTGLLFYHLELSQKLHGPEKFILTCHEDCGYGATKDDLKKSLIRVRREVPLSHTVRAFWIYKVNQGDSYWTYEEV